MIIKQINSRDNIKLKILAKLKQKKYRQELGLFKVENFKIILESKKLPQEIFVTQKFLEKNSKQFTTFITKSNLSEYFQIDENCLDKVTELENSAGIIATYKIFETSLNSKSPIIYLNAVNDPGNLGSILRNAVAFNYKNIVLDEFCADIYNTKVIQASKGAIFNLNIINEKDYKVFNQLKSKKIELLGASLRKDAIDLKKIKIKENYCLVFGSEAHGITEMIENKISKFIKIKMSSQMESLNVASSSAIIFFELNK